MTRSSPLLAHRWPWLLSLIVIAVAYYACYVQYGINFRDEGGTVALLSKRLLDGERPFRDVVLGYNVLWFYPVVGLYKLFGVNFVLLRGYCLALSTLTAILAFLTVERASRRPWFAFLVALLVVFVPGSTFKNYMPLLAVANSFCLLSFALGRRRAEDGSYATYEDRGSYVAAPRVETALPVSEPSSSDAVLSDPSPRLPVSPSVPSWLWLFLGALVLGLTFLIRIDVGTFFLLLWLGAEFLIAMRPRATALARAALLIGGPITTVAVATAVHIPVYLDAEQRGFARPFLAQYEAWPRTLATSLQERLDSRPAVPALRAPAAQPALPPPAPADPSAPGAEVPVVPPAPAAPPTLPPTRANENPVTPTAPTAAPADPGSKPEAPTPLTAPGKPPETTPSDAGFKAPPSPPFPAEPPPASASAPVPAPANPVVPLKTTPDAADAPPCVAPSAAAAEAPVAAPSSSSGDPSAAVPAPKAPATTEAQVPPAFATEPIPQAAPAPATPAPALPSSPASAAPSTPPSSPSIPPVTLPAPSPADALPTTSDAPAAAAQPASPSAPETAPSEITGAMRNAIAHGPRTSGDYPRPDEETSWNTHGLRPKTLAELRTAKNDQERALIILRYAPLFTLIPLALWAAIATVRARRTDVPGAYERHVAALLVVGGALTVFPQYFFFRSDAPHISEFSPGFWVGAFSAVLLLGWGERRRFFSLSRLGASVLLLVLFAHAGLYLWRMLPDRWTGTIAARKNRNTIFHGENGVDVYVSRKEKEALQQLLQLVRDHSGSPSDYLIAYPYHPSLNLLCNRRTYEKNVYIDNATREPGWNQAAIARIQKYRPNVIVLSDWDINGTEDSRFSNWARETKTWIQTNYLTQGNYLEFEVFTRPEKEE